MKIGVFIFLLFGLQSSSLGQNTLLWEIGGKGLSAPSYLFGTMHVLCKGDIPQHDSVVLVMASCKRLVLEMDESTVGVIKQLRFARMRGDTTLGDLLDKEELKGISQFFEDSLGIRLSMLMNMKPALLSSLVMMNALACDQKEVTGVEKELKILADSFKMQVRELETFRYQAALFDSIPYKVQALELVEGVRNYEAFRDELLELVRVYSNQSLDTLALLLHSELNDSYDMEGIFLSQRNRNWIEKMPAMMKKSPCFFAVGAAHLPGENGVIALLRVEGYTVRPIFSDH